MAQLRKEQHLLVYYCNRIVLANFAALATPRTSGLIYLRYWDSHRPSSCDFGSQEKVAVGFFYITIKNLNKVRRRGYRLERVIAVDDDPRKFVHSYGNLVAVHPYEPAGAVVVVAKVALILRGTVLSLGDGSVLQGPDWNSITADNEREDKNGRGQDSSPGTHADHPPW